MARLELPKYMVRRGGVFYYVRRVPTELADQVGKTFERVTTKQTSLRAAIPVVDQINRETEAYWAQLAAGEAGEARQRYTAAVARARALGLGYQTADSLAGGSLDEIVRRVELLEARGALDEPGEVAAVLGGASAPEFTITAGLDAYIELARPKMIKKAPDQVRKWKNPRVKAVRNLVTVIGDKKMAEVSRADALDFRAWWVDRIEVEGLQIETANKDIGHLNGMFRELDEHYRMGMAQPFDRMRLKGGTTGQRTAFEPAFVQGRILAPGALDGLNRDARLVVYLIASTGLRLSEAVNLSACHGEIRLDAEVPHVLVRDSTRELKQAHTAREIPLAGSALAAMRAAPDGFPRYQGKADSLSALVNKYLLCHGLRPTMDHTLYSLRHTFQDRLTAVEAPDRIQADFMGHQYVRPRYGKGATLAHKLEWIEKVAFQAPADL